MSNICPICSGERRVYFQAEILNKHIVDYLYCDRCGLLQTEEPHWLEEAYSDAISDTDTGLIQRNIDLTKIITCILFFLFDPGGKYLDIGGGYGILTRMMRDVGFDFYWSDPYCKNLFAKGFEASKVGARFDGITAFEVLEHVYNPFEFLQNSIYETGAKTVILSTELFDKNPPEINAWNYYACETGQHISFYQHKTLAWIAQKLGYHFSSWGCIHLLSQRIVHPFILRLLIGKASALFYKYAKSQMKSRTMSDHDLIVKLLLSR